MFSSNAQEMRREIAKSNLIISWNFFMTGRGWGDYVQELSDEVDLNYNLQNFVFRKGAGLRWWDSGTGQGKAVKELSLKFNSAQWSHHFVVNSLVRPLRSRFGWPNEIQYFEKRASESMPSEFSETFDLISEMYGPAGIYSLDPSAVLNTYLRSLAVGGRLVLMTSFRTTISLKGSKTRVLNLADWLSLKLRASPDYKVHVTKHKTIWIEKLKSSDFQLPELQLTSIKSEEELYRSFEDKSE